MHTSHFRIRDPFVLPDPCTRTYYLYGTTDANAWAGVSTGFDCYTSKNLVDWKGPIPVFRPSATFWANRNFWAPEVYFYNNAYFMLASFKAVGLHRGTQILKANHPTGPFEPITDAPVTPRDWECLDGTLFFENNSPWIVFCREWVQIGDGEICAAPLSPDLTHLLSPPLTLFSASQAPWAYPITTRVEKDQIRAYPADGRTGQPTTSTVLFSSNASEWLQPEHALNYVTDGPFLFYTPSRELCMLWSSFGKSDYAMGVARSVSGTVAGPWEHLPHPLFSNDGGHGMLFEDFNAQLHVTLHQPNEKPLEHACFFKAGFNSDCQLTLL